MAILALATGACGGPPSVVPVINRGPLLPPPPGPATLDAVFVLESGGPPADDTTVTIRPGQPRTILLRRGSPDNSLFATLVVADTTAGAPVRITIAPGPGLYAVDLAADGPWPARVTLMMSYAVHFVAPAGARERYGNDLGFERALFLARAEPGGRVEFLTTARPGSDLVEAAITGPGRYLVAAPRR